MHRDAERVQRVIRVLLAAATVGPLGGACYRYVPVVEPIAAPGEEVRVHLSRAGAADLAREIGPRMASVEARVIDIEPDSSLRLAVSQLRSSSGEPVAWQGDTPLLVPRSAIASVERRQLARGRTVAASTAATVALAAIGVLAVRGADRGGGSGGPPPPPPP